MHYLSIFLLLFLVGCTQDNTTPKKNTLTNLEKRYRFLPKEEIIEPSIAEQDKAFNKKVQSTLKSIEVHKKSLVKKEKKRQKLVAKQKKKKHHIYISNGETYKKDKAPRLTKDIKDTANSNALKMYF